MKKKTSYGKRDQANVYPGDSTFAHIADLPKRKIKWGNATKKKQRR